MRREDELSGIRVDGDGEAEVVARMSATIANAVREASARAIEGAIGGGSVETAAPITAPFHPIMNIRTLKPNLEFVNEVADGRTELGKLLDNPPTLTGKATEDTDGRRVPVLVTVVRNQEGRTRAGIELRLLDRETGGCCSTTAAPTSVASWCSGSPGAPGRMAPRKAPSRSPAPTIRSWWRSPPARSTR